MMSFTNITSTINPKSIRAECYKNLSENVEILAADSEKKIIMVASAETNEGRTITASNIAFLMAQNKRKILLIDCDQRKPNIHNMFELSNEKGLIDVLKGNNNFDEVVQATEQPGFSILTLGGRSSELIEFHLLEDLFKTLRENFDYIIIDTPPLLLFPDAAIISKYSDGCLFVVNSGRIDRKAAIEAKELLVKANANIMGVVLNKAKFNPLKSQRKYYKRA